MWESAAWFWPCLGVLLVVAVLVHAFVEEPARVWIRGRAVRTRRPSYG